MSNQNPSPQNEGKYSLFMGFVYVSNLIVGTGMADNFFFENFFRFFKKITLKEISHENCQVLLLADFLEFLIKYFEYFFTQMGFKRTILIFKTK